MKYSYTCKRCGDVKLTATHREYCRNCTNVMAKLAENKSAFLPGAEPRKWAQISDQETIQSLSYLVHRLADIGPHSEVLHYTPDHPDFQRLAAEITEGRAGR